MDSGIRALSSIYIDADKDWAGKKIENLGAPDTDYDALRYIKIAGKFTFDSRLDDMEAHQGVASDGTYLYNSLGSAGVGKLYRRNKTTGAIIASNLTALVGGTAMQQINSIHVYGDYLYVGANNYSITPMLGYIRVYNKGDLAYVEEHQVKDYWCEGCAFYDDAWWVVYCGLSDVIVSKYNSGWAWVADYTLSFPQAIFDPSLKGYQGIIWIGDYIYVNIHEGNIPHTCDVYKWNGISFDEIARLDRPTSYCTQSLCQEPGEDIIWWAERDTSTGFYNIVKSSIEWMRIVPHLSNLLSHSSRIVGCHGISDEGILTLPYQSRARGWRETTAMVYPTGIFAKIALNAEVFDSQDELDITVISGTTDNTRANELEDTSKDFEALGVQLGWGVWNTTDNTYARVSDLTNAAAGRLGLTADIMVNGENYEVYAARFTAKEDGYYEANALIHYENPVVDTRYYCRLEKNGGELSQSNLHSSVAEKMYVPHSDIMQLDAGDYLELVAYHTAGGDVTGGKYVATNFLAVHKLS